MQIDFHLLENEWNNIVWLRLFYDLHSTKQSKTEKHKTNFESNQNATSRCSCK